jgi:hypothetical protein
MSSTIRYACRTPGSFRDCTISAPGSKPLRKVQKNLQRWDSLLGARLVRAFFGEPERPRHTFIVELSVGPHHGLENAMRAHVSLVVDVHLYSHAQAVAVWYERREVS